MTQRLEDYWLGLRLQQMDIPAIHLVKADDVEDNSPLLLDAVEMYLNTKGKTDKTFIRTARRNAAYVAKVLGNRPTEKLIKMFENAAFGDFDIGYSDDRETIILRDENKNDVEYEDKTHIKQMRLLVQAYNKLLEKTFHRYPVCR